VWARGDLPLDCKNGVGAMGLKCVKRDQSHRHWWHPILPTEDADGCWRLYGG